jgi:uncharacterized Zn finger protein (UPF0148 family)
MSEFGALNLEDIQGDAARLNTSAENQENYLDNFILIPDPKPGQTITFPVRILPPRKGAKLFQYTRLHLINDRKYQCPRPLVNGKWDYKTPCPICDYYNALYRQKDKLEKMGRKAEAEKLEQEAKSIKPIERYYYNAVARKMVNSKGETLMNAGPKILSVGKVLHKIIVGHIVGGEGMTKLGDVTHVKNGWDFEIIKQMRGTGKDAYPNYDRSAFSRDSTAAGTPDEIAKWVEGLHDLSLNRKPTEFDILEKQLAIHRGLIPDDKDGFDVEKFDAKWKGQDGSKKSSVSVPRNVSEDEVHNVINTPSVEDVVSPAEAPAEDLNIEDTEFLDKLEGMRELV